MDTQQLAAQLERARSTAVVLYTGGELLPVEYDRLIAGVAAGELLLTEVARLHTDADGLRAELARLEASNAAFQRSANEWREQAYAAQAEVARLQADLDGARAARVRAESERDEARGDLIDMLNGGEPLPSSIFHKAQAWRDATE